MSSIQISSKQLFSYRSLGIFLLTISAVLTIRWMAVSKEINEPLAALPQILFAITGLLMKRKGDKINTELFLEFQRQLNRREIEIQNLNPKSIINDYPSLSSAISQSLLTNKLKRTLLARAVHLKGLALILLDSGEKNEAYQLLIEAYEKEKTNFKYKERALTSYFGLDDIKMAVRLAEDVISFSESHNPRAWYVKTMSSEDFDIADLIRIPQVVRNDKTFVFQLCNRLIKLEKIEFAHDIMTRDFLKVDLPQNLKTEDIQYWTLILILNFNQELINNPNSNAEYKNPNLANNPIILKCLNLSEKLMSILENTEVLLENRFYQMVVYLHHYGRYLLTDSKAPILELFDYCLNSKITADNRPLNINVIILLCQIQEYQKAIDFYDFIDDDYHQMNNLAGFACIRLGQEKHGINYLQRFVEGVDVFHKGEASSVIGLFRLMNSNGLDPISYFNQVVANKTFEFQLDKKVAELSAYRYDQESEMSKLRRVELLDQIYPDYESLTQELKVSLCEVLHETGEYDKCDSLLKGIYIQTKDSYSLFLYINNLYRIKKEHSLLISLLEYWRFNCTILHTFLIYEIVIHNELRNDPKVEEVCECGLTISPNEPVFVANLISSIFKQDNRADTLLEHLNERLLTIKFNWSQALAIAKICLESGFIKLGFDLIYPYVKNDTENYSLRQNYFILMGQYGDSIASNPEIVETDSTVRLVIGSDIKIVHVNEASLNDNRYARQIIGKRVGDSVELLSSFSDNTKKAVIGVILDKYSGLANEIMEEISNGIKLTGYEMGEISWNGDDIQNLYSKLIDEHGESGEKRRIFIAEAFEKYKSGNLSFLELVRKTGPNRILDIYKDLTLDPSKGFIAPPMFLFVEKDMTKIEEFVLDISVIPSLVEISKKFECNFPKFIVSQYLKDFLKMKVSEFTQMPDSTLTLNVTLTRGVEHIRFPENYKLEYLAWLNDLLNWVETHCQVSFAPQKLDIMLNAPSLSKLKGDWHYEYVLDTIFLSEKENRSLVADDMFYHISFPLQTFPVSLEYFLKISDFTVDFEAVRLTLIEHNYLGLTPSTELLKLCYERSPLLESPNNAYRKIIRGLPFSYHKNSQVIYEVIDFLKFIYSITMELSMKNRLAEYTFLEVLKGYPLEKESAQVFTDYIKKEFSLLGNYGNEVMKSMTRALEILNKSLNL